MKKDSVFLLKYFYLLAGLSLALAIAAVYYVSWENNRIMKMEEILIEFHKTTISETLKIEKEISRFEKTIANLSPSNREIDGTFTHKINHDQFKFIIKESLELIFNLQNKYKYPKYQNILKNLKTRWEQFSSFEDSQEILNEPFHEKSHELSKSISIVVHQLQRLHMADEMSLLAKIRKEINNKDNKIILFVSFLILSGSTISYLILKKLQEVLRARDQGEKELNLYRNHLEKMVEQRTSELREKNEQLVYAEKLTATGKLSASIAHEFNNPLFGIKNVLEEVKEGVGMDAAYEKLVNIGIKECNRIADLIKNLQDFYRPSQGVFEWVDIYKTIDEVFLLIKTRLEKRKISFKLKRSDHLPKIEAVLDQFKQVILNLLHKWR
jgi:signal transduction histidine kinase